MKRSILIILSILFLALPLYAEDNTCSNCQQVAGGIMMIGGGTPAAGGCTIANATAIFDNTALGVSNTWVINSSNVSAQYFTFTGTKTITHYKIAFDNVPAAGNVTLSLYTDKTSDCPGGAAHCPDSIISDTSQTVAASVSVVEFDLVTPKTGLTSPLWLYIVGVGSVSALSNDQCGGIADPGWYISDAGTIYANALGQVGVWGCAE